MSLGRSLRRRARALLLPAILFLFAGYFGWQATQGSRGLHAYAQRQQEEKAALAELDAARSDLAIWQRRVAALRGGHLDTDVLDERVRAMLNLSRPDDIIVPYGQGKNLF
jgi:cell division protein FtsB